MWAMSICDPGSVLTCAFKTCLILILYDYIHVIMKYCCTGPMSWLLVNTWFMIGSSGDLVTYWSMIKLSVTYGLPVTSKKLLFKRRVFYREDKALSQNC